MLQYVSNLGDAPPVDFETAILNGYAPDGGLYVPEHLPQISLEDLRKWKNYTYQELAFEITSLFIDRSIISGEALQSIIKKAYGTFEKEDVIPIPKLTSQEDTFIMELFYGSTLSFKDIGLSFLVNLVDFFLSRQNEHLTLMVATTGDTGPAAASYVADKESLDVWVLYPKGLITEEQERQMTTLHKTNVHPVGVLECPNGADDLDAVIANLYANSAFKEKVKLSSVNSINWGRVMIQTVHYFYGYLQLVDQVGDQLSLCVPSGAFGNLCAGGIARKMGLPITYLIAANGKNECIHRIFSKGYFSKEDLHESLASAIDIQIPYNFWRFLYFCVDNDASKIKKWQREFEDTGKVQFDSQTVKDYQNGFLSGSVSDEDIMTITKTTFEAEGYLLDPHTAVAVQVAKSLRTQLGKQKVICLSTAHPSKFKSAILRSLDVNELPEAALHPSIEAAKYKCEKGYTVHHKNLEKALIDAVLTQHNQRVDS